MNILYPHNEAPQVRKPLVAIVQNGRVIGLYANWLSAEESFAGMIAMGVSNISIQQVQA